MYRWIAAALIVGFLAGWKVQGWRAGQQIAEVKTEQVTVQAKAETAARTDEREQVKAADKLRKDKDVQIESIRRRLDNALIELRKRQERPASSSEMPSTAAACDGARGSELYREDAEFLEREAARADETAVKLNACIAQYNEIKRHYETSD